MTLHKSTRDILDDLIEAHHNEDYSAEQAMEAEQQAFNEALEALDQLHQADKDKALVELITKLDNSVPNFWKTNQTEYTHQDMQRLLDLMQAEKDRIELKKGTNHE